MRLECGECKAVIKQPKVPRRVSCNSCEALLDLTSAPVAHALKLQTEGEQPRGLRVSLEIGAAEDVGGAYRGSGADRTAATLRVRQSWVSPKSFVLAGFALVWDAFLVGWYVAVTPDGADLGPVGLGISCCFLVFPLLHVGLGILLTYMAAASLFNATEVRANREGMSVKYGPFPIWTGSAWTATLSSIQQLMVRRDVRTGMRTPEGRWPGAWQVMADLQGEELKTIVRELQGREHARHLEQLLEGFLDIEDKPDASHPAED